MSCVGRAPSTCTDLMQSPPEPVSEAPATEQAYGNAAAQECLPGEWSDTPTLDAWGEEESAEPVASLDEAKAALTAWSTQARSLAVDGGEWVIQNWTEFLGKAGGTPWMSIGADGLITLTKNTAANLGGEVAVSALEYWLASGASLTGGKAVGAAVGTAAGGPLGTVIGFAVGCVAEEFVGMAVDALVPDLTAQETALAATKQMAGALGSVVSTAFTEMRSAEGSVTEVHEGVLGALVNAKDPLALTAVVAHLRAETAMLSGTNPGDRSLRDALLRDWTLENAGTAERAGDSCNQAAWGEAVGAPPQGGPLERLGQAASALWWGSPAGLGDEPALFAYQTRGELGRAGLDTAAAGTWIEEIERQSASADEVVAHYDGVHCVHREPEDPDRLADFLYAHADPDTWGKDGFELLHDKIRAGVDAEFELCVQPTLGVDRWNSPYVIRWDWHLSLNGRPDELHFVSTP